MLQNDPVRNLQYDSEIRVAQQPYTEPRVFDGPLSITSQPRRQSQGATLSSGPARIDLPISTVNPYVRVNHTFIPKTGYDSLTDVPSVHIEQTFELNESLTAVSSENRFVIRSPLGEAIYAASETSSRNDRLFWGAGRPFELPILDKTHQEAVVLRKKFALGAMCCQPPTLEVWLPSGQLLGRIVKSPTFFLPVFYIEDGETGEPVFRIEGPKNAGICCFCLQKESYFKIHSGGDLRASIDHKWMTSKSQYTTNVYFSDSKLTAKERALIVSSAFMLEYMFFQR